MSTIAVPSKLDEKFLYIWKIIDRPLMTLNELIYYMAFDLHLTTPQNARDEINEAIRSGILTVTQNLELSLNSELQKQLEEFQKQGILKYRKMLAKLKDSWGPGPVLLQKSQTQKSSSPTQVKEAPKESIDQVLEQLTAKSTVQTGLKIKETDVVFETQNFDAGIISGKVTGSEGTPYTFLIDAQTKILSHNCVDFSMKRARKKEICKHLVKVFELLLKNQNQNAKKIVEQIINDKLNWKFNG